MVRAYLFFFLNLACSSFKRRGDELDGDLGRAMRESLDNYNQQRQQQQQQQQQRRIVGRGQTFIFSAFIHASSQIRPPPYQVAL